jgi:outer membrane protein OmpA-like peptidoglycan-associated protein
MMRKTSIFYLVILPGILMTSCAARMSVDRASQVSDTRPSSDGMGVRDYSYDYNQVVLGTAGSEVQVICKECERSTRLERELGDVPLSVLWGREQVVSAGTSSLTQRPVITPKPTQALRQSVVSFQQEPSKGTAKINNPDPENGSSTRSKDGEHESTGVSCQTPPVYFDFDSSVLMDREKLKILASLNDLKKVKAVMVKGFTCDKGTMQYNDRLALLRARAVAAYLEDNGVKPSVVMGKGKCCYVSEDKRKNRRAEILCLK